jgi:hypothetical protein
MSNPSLDTGFDIEISTKIEGYFSLLMLTLTYSDGQCQVMDYEGIMLAML